MTILPAVLITAHLAQRTGPFISISRCVAPLGDAISGRTLPARVRPHVIPTVR